MRIYLKRPLADDRAMARIEEALIRHAPKDVEVVGSIEEADLVLLHVIGRLDRIKRMTTYLQEQGKEYAILQYAIRSTKTPHTKDWISVWQGAKLVWSYYDLPSLCEEDGTSADFPSYTSPLGTYFDSPLRKKQYVIATSGRSYLTESVRECRHATSGKVFHVGPDLGRDDFECSNGMNDVDLAVRYSQCQFVSGLRRIEGLELPAVEGLMCGARPIVFDRPDHRLWYEGLAEFIPEGSREEVIESLKEVFAKGARPVSTEEKKIARERFNWCRILTEFYERLHG